MHPAAAMANMPPDQQKYMIEAEKRKRADGMSQFQQLHFSDNERLRGLVDDLWADHATLEQQPQPIEHGGCIKFLIMGAGMGGILYAIKLIKRGFSPEQIVLIEPAGGVGGTWYWNRYPGLHCDVEAYCYLPLLEETGYMPSSKYASAVEIRKYLEGLVEKFNLMKRVMFRSQVNGLQWDESIHAWRADMTQGRGLDGKEKQTFWLSAEYVILATGLFPHPQAPKIPGLAGFEGPMFHSARWDYGVTGGSCNDPFPVMDKLKEARVGLVGTGATAIQVVPELAKHAKELFVFQRTPSQVNVRNQRDTDPTEWREHIAAKPGWQTERMENLADHLSVNHKPGAPNLVDDEWSKLHAYCAIVGSNQFGIIAPEKIPDHISMMMARDAEHNVKARQRVKEIVKDSKTAEELTPWYPTWCKRPTFSDLYLQAFNKPNVHLIDTNGKGIDSVMPKGIVANGQEFPVDVLVLTTGYRSPGYAHSDPAKRIGIEIVGPEGKRITDKWAEKGTATVHGVCTNGFPNLFWTALAQASATANVNHMLTVQTDHVSHIISEAHKRMGGHDKQGVLVEPTEEAEEEWSMRIVPGASFFSPVAVCTPGYMTNEGEALVQPEDAKEKLKKARGSQWLGGLVSYTRELEKWRDEGFKGVNISVA